MSTNHPHANRGNAKAPDEDVKPASTYGMLLLHEAVIESKQSQLTSQKLNTWLEIILQFSVRT